MEGNWPESLDQPKTYCQLPSRRSLAYRESAGYSHMKYKHEGLKYSCKLCEYKSTAQSSLAKHIQYKHDRVRYSCDQCNYTSTQNVNLTTHIQSKHEGVTYSCNLCGYKFTA